MKVNNIQPNTTNFNGYKNLMTRRLADKPNAPYFTYMAMQLNNIGKNDLEVWQNIQKNVLNRKNITDIFTFSYLHFPKTQDYMWFGGKLLGDELTKFSKYFGEHADTLKSYIFAHDLTGRIMNDNSWLVRDNKLMDVAKQARDDLNKVFDMNLVFGTGDANKNKAMATDIVANTFLKEDAPQANAGEINHDMYKLFLPFLSDGEC